MVKKYNCLDINNTTNTKNITSNNNNNSSNNSNNYCYNIKIYVFCGLKL